MIVCGDFNIDLMKNNKHSAKHLVINETSGFDQLIREPNRFGSQSDTLLGHNFERNANVENI